MNALIVAVLAAVAYAAGRRRGRAETTDALYQLGWRPAAGPD